MDFLEALEQALALPYAMVQQVLLEDDVDDARASHHVHQVAAPGAVDAAGDLEDPVHLVQATARSDAAGLGLLAEGEDVGLHVEPLVRPPLARGAEARLHFVEDQQELVTVCQDAELLQELGAEVVVAALTLDGLHNEAGDVIGVLRHGGFDGGDGRSLGSFDLGEVHGEGQLGVRHAGPGELGEVLVLAGIRCVGEAQGVAGAAVEGLTEVDDLGALLALPGRQVLPHLPVEGRLQGVLHRQGAAVDPEQVGQVVGGRMGAEGLHPLRIGRGVDVGVGGLVDRDLAQALNEGGVPQAGVVVPQGRCGEKGVEVQVFSTVPGVHNPGPMGLVEIHDQVKAVHQHVAAKAL